MKKQKFIRVKRHRWLKRTGTIESVIINDMDERRYNLIPAWKFEPVPKHIGNHWFEVYPISWQEQVQIILTNTFTFFSKYLMRALKYILYFV